MAKWKYLICEEHGDITGTNDPENLQSAYNNGCTIIHLETLTFGGPNPDACDEIEQTSWEDENGEDSDD